MPDFRTMFDSDYLKAWHLDGKPRTLTIAKVEAGSIENRKAKKQDRMPFVFFKNVARPLGLNKTNAKAIAGIYGTRTEEWVGKRVTIFPTTTSFGNDTVDCIRVKPGIPGAKADDDMPTAAPPASPPHDPVTGEVQA